MIRLQRSDLLRGVLAAPLLAALAGSSAGQSLTVLAEEKLASGSGGLTGPLDDGDFFGSSVALLGDLDDDGVDDVAVGARGDDDGGSTSFLFTRGAVYVLFLNADGSVKAEQKISATAGGFTGGLDDGDEFGVSVAAIGDLDGDGNTELAVGARFDDDGGAGSTANRGAVYVLFLDDDGTVKSQQKISAASGMTLADSDFFGASVGGLGDLDGNGAADLAVGAPGDDTGGSARGTVWVLLLNTDGTVASSVRLASSTGGMVLLDDGDAFGVSIAALGDLESNGSLEVAIGALGDDDGGGGSTADRGAVWVLSLNASGSADSVAKISDTAGGFLGTLDDGDEFGASVANLGDLDGDGIVDLCVGAARDDDGGTNRGAVWVLRLDVDATVLAADKIATGSSAFDASLDDNDLFGSAVTAADLGGDGFLEIFVGARLDDDGGSARGACYVLTVVPAYADATATFRNGNGNNPAGYTSLSDPVLGTQWTSAVDLAGGVASLVVVSTRGPLPPGIVITGTINGEVLCRPPFTVNVASGSHAIPIPAQVKLIGVSICTQGGVLQANGKVTLQNALDLTLGTF